MEQLIGVVNKLQDKFALLNIECTINLPQIAVVGEQSSGKSSVLENFVGRDFLPRGSGIVTRRPLILQLFYTVGTEYAEFSHISNKKFVNFSEVRKEIEIETDRLVGATKSVSSIPINLRIYSPDVLNLTLVDLPGLTKVPVGGQPSDIELQIRHMILSFISNPNCLILVVVPAITDIANSDALKLACEVDPHKMRTIGVITKIDMMGEGTDCVEILENRVYQLPRGYIGVVNRSQRDIEWKKDIHSARTFEMDFFRRHSKYRRIIDRLGTQNLQKSLCLQLSDHIMKTLPDVRNKIIDKLTCLKQKIDENPDLFHDSSNTSTSVSKILIIKIQALSKKISTALGYEIENIDLEKKSPGSEILEILGQTFLEEVEKYKPSCDEMKKGIKMAILNTQGIRQSLMSENGPFTSVTKHFIRFLDQPCYKIVDMVSSIMCHMIQQFVDEQFCSYPYLRVEVSRLLLLKVSEFTDSTKKFLKIYLLAQAEHINTNHPDFLATQDYHRSKEKKDDQHPIIGMENTIHIQGSLLFTGQGPMKSAKNHFFVLRGQSLIVYKDNTKKSFKDQINLSGCIVKDVSSGKSAQLLIYHKEGLNLTKKLKKVELIFKDLEELECWKEAFFNAGLKLDSTDDKTKYITSLESNVEEGYIKHVQYIYSLVNSYFDVTIKIIQDTLIKIVLSSLIANFRNSILNDLVVHLYSLCDLEEYMKESDEAASSRQETLDLRETCIQALDTVDSFIVSSDFNIPVPSKSIPTIKKISDDNISAPLNSASYKSRTNITMHTKAGSEASLLPIKNTEIFARGSFKDKYTENLSINSYRPKKPQRLPPTPDKNIRHFDATAL